MFSPSHGFDVGNAIDRSSEALDALTRSRALSEGRRAPTRLGERPSSGSTQGGRRSSGVVTHEAVRAISAARPPWWCAPPARHSLLFC